MLGPFPLTPLLERSENLCSETPLLRLSENGSFTPERATRRLAVGLRSFLPCPHSLHRADKTGRCPLWAPSALTAWNVSAPIAFWSKNIQTTNTASTSHTPAGFYALSCASCHWEYHRQSHSRSSGCLSWLDFSSLLFALSLFDKQWWVLV